ncbi:DUF4123 domain-containing protein [Acinetobacter sp. ESBL14]|uniref:DUF4123 domain-containing protein n=1 Tax=Acinetobacter sp. ESBL14 TaxID=3077329 RepID=UPI002FCA7F76
MIIQQLENKEFNDEMIWENILKVYQQDKHVVFLLDKTLFENFLVEQLPKFSHDEIAYIPIAQSTQKSPLYLLRLTKIEQLESIRDDLVYFLKKNFDFRNDCYVVCGFGRSADELDVLAKHLRNTLVLNDQGKKVYFRWFDPRVLVYLNIILDDERVASLLHSFDEWNFYHVSGVYLFSKEDRIAGEKFKKLQISPNESINLDLIEVSNLAYQQAFNLMPDEHTRICPLKTLLAIQSAYHDYQITNYPDLISYALYSWMIHPQFMQYKLTRETLQQYWLNKAEVGSFTDAMNFLAESHWEKMKEDLLNKEYGYE